MRALRAVFLFAAAAVAQWWWSSHLALWGLAPQLLLVLTVAVAARSGANPGMAYGFLWGLSLDLLRAQLFGGNAFTLMLAGYATGTLRRQIDLSDFLSLCAVVFLATWGYFLCYGLLGAIFTKSFLWPGWSAFLCDPLYNCLLAPLAARIAAGPRGGRS